MANAKPTLNFTFWAPVEEVKQPPADNCDSTDRDPKNFMEIFPNSWEAFKEFMKGGLLSSTQAKIWDKKLNKFIDFAAKMRKKPGLVGSPIYVRTHNGLGTQETTRSDHDPRPGIPTPSQKLQSRLSSLGFSWDGMSCGKSWDKKKSFSGVTLSQDKGRSKCPGTK